MKSRHEEDALKHMKTAVVLQHEKLQLHLWMLYSLVLYITVWYSLVLYSTVWYCTVLYSSVLYSTILYYMYSAVEYCINCVKTSTVQFSGMVLYCNLLYWVFPLQSLYITLLLIHYCTI